MNLNKSIYGNRTSGGRHGDVFTSLSTVQFMLDKVGYTADNDLRNIRILEPACGEGEFVIEIAKRLQHSAARFSFNAEAAFRNNVRAYDIDANKIKKCRNRIQKLGFKLVENIQVADFLTVDATQTDIVVGNPPYVRYENIPEKTLDYCKRTFTTFYYRSDLYIPFFEKSLSLLKNKGTHCFICPNRWLKNEYGKKLRLYISRSYRLRMIVDLEQVNPFQEEVSAYPAITLISADTPNLFFEYAECHEISQINSLQTVQKSMPTSSNWTEAFTEVPPMLQTIEEQGFKIGIGAATGADSVFISDQLPYEVESNLILPAINARDLRGDKLQWQGKYLLNPYTVSGELIDLKQYPKAKQYFEKYREKLSRRHIASKNPTRWYRTIDRIVPSLLFQPKVLLPDMSKNTFVFVDNGYYYPLHNIYYVTGRSVTELRLLAALLMSDFIRKQLSSITNKMNGGFSRWQSQYLRKLHLPEIKSIPPKEAQIMLDCYDRKDLKAINALTSNILDGCKIERSIRKASL